MKLLSIEQSKANIIASVSDINLPASEMWIYLRDHLKDSTESFSLLYHALMHINNSPIEKRTNICSEISRFVHNVLEDCKMHDIDMVSVAAKGTIANFIKTGFSDIAFYWPKYSGEETYPVPYKFPIGEDGYVSPYCVFWENHYHDTLWEGEYGALREELLKFSIDYLNKKFKSGE